MSLFSRQCLSSIFAAQRIEEEEEEIAICQLLLGDLCEKKTSFYAVADLELEEGGN